MVTVISYICYLMSHTKFRFSPIVIAYNTYVHSLNTISTNGNIKKEEHLIQITTVESLIMQ